MPPVCLRRKRRPGGANRSSALARPTGAGRVHIGRAMFAKAAEVTTIRPAPDPTPFSRAQLDGAARSAAAAIKRAADRTAALYGA